MEKNYEGRIMQLPASFQIWANIPPAVGNTPHIEPTDPEDPAEPDMPAASPAAELPQPEKDMKPATTDGEMVRESN